VYPNDSSNQGANVDRTVLAMDGTAATHLDGTRAGHEVALWRVQGVERFLAVSANWVYMATRSGVLPRCASGAFGASGRRRCVPWSRGSRVGGKGVQLPRCR